MSVIISQEAMSRGSAAVLSVVAIKSGGRQAPITIKYSCSDVQQQNFVSSSVRSVSFEHLTSETLVSVVCTNQCMDNNRNGI